MTALDFVEDLDVIGHLEVNVPCDVDEDDTHTADWSIVTHMECCGERALAGDFLCTPHLKELLDSLSEEKKALIKCGHCGRVTLVRRESDLLHVDRVETI